MNNNTEQLTALQQLELMQQAELPLPKPPAKNIILLKQPKGFAVYDVRGGVPPLLPDEERWSDEDDCSRSTTNQRQQEGVS